MLHTLVLVMPVSVQPREEYSPPVREYLAHEQGLLGGSGGGSGSSVSHLMPPRPQSADSSMSRLSRLSTFNAGGLGT